MLTKCKLTLERIKMTELLQATTSFSLLLQITASPEWPFLLIRSLVPGAASLGPRVVDTADGTKPAETLSCLGTI